MEKMGYERNKEESLMFKKIFKNKEYNFDFSENDTVSIDLTKKENIVYIIHDSNGMIKDSGELGSYLSSPQVQKLYDFFQQAINSRTKITFKKPARSLENKSE